MIYLASPYSHPDPAVREERYTHTMRWLVDFTRWNFPIYSPIVHWHTAAVLFELPTDAEFWLKQNLGLLRNAQRLLVLQLPGWEESKGVQQEIKWATDVMPITYFNPETRKTTGDAL